MEVIMWYLLATGLAVSLPPPCRVLLFPARSVSDAETRRQCPCLPGRGSRRAAMRAGRRQREPCARQAGALPMGCLTPRRAGQGHGRLGRDGELRPCRGKDELLRGARKGSKLWLCSSSLPAELELGDLVLGMNKGSLSIGKKL